MRTPKPTADEIRAYRDAQECSIYEARAVLHRAWQINELKRLRACAGELYTVEACRDIIADLLDFILDHIVT